jgi:hypothetical protein
MINTEAVVIALPKVQALKFTTEHNLNAAPVDALKALDQLVQEKQAESVANPSVTSKDGQIGTSENATTKLEAEPSLNAPGDMIDVNIVLEYNGKKLITALTARSGEVRFLGSFDDVEKEKSVTCLAFVIIRASLPMPPISDMFTLSVSLGTNVEHNPSLDYLPITLRIKNKRTDNVKVDTVQKICEIAIYSVDNTGKMRVVLPFSFGFNEAPQEFHTLVEVKAGETGVFSSYIPLEFLNNKRLAVAIRVDGGDYAPPYVITSKPFAVPILK